MENHLLYCQHSGDFYDRPDTLRTPGFRLPEIASSPDWICDSDGFWTHLTPVDADLPEQGWKVHVSAIFDEAEEVIGITADYCAAYRMAFKFLHSSHIYLLANGKYAPRGGSGKLVTIYPRDADELHRTLTALSVLLDGRPGPYVLSDLRWKAGPLYLRYGAFRTMSCTDDRGATVPAIRLPDGTLRPDTRGPSFVVPEWAPVPDFIAAQIEESSRVTGAPLPYRVERALHFSNGGGIYLARDESTGSTVVLREARPYAGLDATGATDAVSRLRREAATLEELSDLGVGPRYLGVFTAWEHHFLAQEHIEGETLWTYLTKHHPLIKGNSTADELAAFVKRAEDLLAQVDLCLRTLHDRGYVFADLHPHNIMVEPGTRVRLVDFEIAYRPDRDPAPSIGAPGFVAAHASEGFQRDHYALNALRLAMYLPLTQMLDLDPSKADHLADAVAELFPDAAGTAEQARIGLRAPGTPSPSHNLRASFDAAARDTSGVALHDLRQSIARSIVAEATPQRLDRLFPGDPGGLTDGGYNLNSGAAGVLLAFLLTGQPAAEEFTDWLAAAVRRCEPVSGLYNGMHGAAVVLHALGRPDDALAAMHRVSHDAASSNLFGGLAGIGLALRYFARTTDDRRWRDELNRVQQQLITRMGGDGERPGLMYGSTGTALFFLRRFTDTGDPGLLELARAAFAPDLAGLRVDETGGAILTDGTRELAYLADGSAGMLAPLDLYLRHRPDDELAIIRDAIVPACGVTLTVESGLLLGRAGLLAALTATRPTPLTAGLIEQHIRRLVWHAVPRDGDIAFPGRWLLKLSTDLATGAAGVLVALPGRRPVLPGWDLLAETAGIPLAPEPAA